MPLTGVRVLDLTRVLAGPLCAMTLGDLGADVIKVERPGSGDDTRGWGPPFDERGQSAYFLSINRNKLSLACDFRHEPDRKLLLDLIAEADVVVENFLPGVLGRFGFDADAILSSHPKLIWCTVSGFGPGSKRPGYDFVAQAESGWMSITGPVEGPPFKVGVALVDVITGKDATIAILATLAGIARGRQVSRRLHLSLTHSAVASLVNVAQNALVSPKSAERWGNAHPNLVPYQLFDASDRPFVIAVGSDKQWLSLLHALGLSHVASEPRYHTNAGRVTNRQAVTYLIQERVREAPAAHWIALLDDADVPCGLVRTVQEALTDVQSNASTGIYPAQPGTVRLVPPLLSEHSAAIRKKHWSVFDMLPILPS